MKRIEDLKYGQIVTVRSWGGGTRTGEIVDIDSEGKGGRATIGLTLTKPASDGSQVGENCWAYIEQIL